MSQASRCVCLSWECRDRSLSMLASTLCHKLVPMCHRQWNVFLLNFTVDLLFTILIISFLARKETNMPKIGSVLISLQNSGNENLHLNLCPTALDKPLSMAATSTLSAGSCDRHTRRGREELHHVRGQGQKLGGPHAQGSVDKKSYPTSEVRSSG